MQKTELISLVDNMCKELLTIIDEQDDATAVQVSKFLSESAAIIENVKKQDFTKIGFAESLFHNAYEEVARNSIASYKKTNENIEELTKLHEDALFECRDEQIDLPAITSKFQEIQTHMSLEVTKANDVIGKLTQQVKMLEAKTNLDALTKVYNRRALSSYLDKICEKKKAPFNLHILLLDIDDFKEVNDIHGHVAGDKVLIFLANLLKKALRDGDKVFRYGGEEFLIILNRVDDNHCKETANRLISMVKDNKLIYKGNNINTTISVGTTKFIQGDTPDTFVNRADKALYRAKKNGKNQYCTEEVDGI